MIIYVSIGNSDDKLTQAQWSAFYCDVDRLLEPGYLIEIDPDLPVVPRTGLPEMSLLTWLHSELSRLAQIWNQDSIAWAQTPVTEFIKPSPTRVTQPPNLEDPT